VRWSRLSAMAGHAGTVPMNLRRDAAAAAAEIVLAVEKRCNGTPGLVGTATTNAARAREFIPARGIPVSTFVPTITQVRSAAFNEAVAAAEKCEPRTRHNGRSARMPSGPCALPRPTTAHWSRASSASSVQKTIRHLASGAGHGCDGHAADHRYRSCSSLRQRRHQAITPRNDDRRPDAEIASLVSKILV